MWRSRSTICVALQEQLRNARRYPSSGAATNLAVRWNISPSWQRMRSIRSAQNESTALDHGSTAQIVVPTAPPLAEDQHLIDQGKCRCQRPNDEIQCRKEQTADRQSPERSLVPRLGRYDHNAHDG